MVNPAVEAQATDRAHRIGRNGRHFDQAHRSRHRRRARLADARESELLEGTMDAEAAMERLTMEDRQELASG